MFIYHGRTYHGRTSFFLHELQSVWICSFDLENILKVLFGFKSNIGTVNLVHLLRRIRIFYTQNIFKILFKKNLLIKFDQS